MNIYSFINSKDIAKHCRKLNHQFTPIESAYLIWRSGWHTIEEKHKAWNKLIETTTDTEVPNTEYSSLHDFLREYIERENKWLDEFYVEEDAEYFYVCYYDHVIVFNSQCNNISFKSLNALYEDFKVFYKKEECKIDYIVLYKIKPNQTTVLIALPNGKGIKQINYGDMGEHKIQDDVFRSMCPIVPTPFKKGDIVTFVSSPEMDFYRDKKVFTNDVYVVDCTGTEDVEDVFKSHSYLWHDAQDKEITNDSTILYKVNGLGYIEHLCEPFYLEYDYNNYLDLEYYHKELNGNQRILIAISNYLKGHIDLSFLINSHFAIMFEENSKELLSDFYLAKYCGAYDLPLQLVGLSNKEIEDNYYVNY